MVIESIINPRVVERKPYHLYFVGLFYAFVGIFLALMMPFTNKSLSAVFLTTMACVPFLVNEIQREESEIIKGSILERHKDIIAIFFFLFMGMLTSFIIGSALFPDDIYSVVFEEQYSEIARVRGSFDSQAGAAVGIETGVGLSGAAVDPTNTIIFFLSNNFRVMLACLLFSFLYGAGAIFLLAWNASTLGVVIGTTIRNAAAQFGWFNAVNIGLGSYLVHGIPEMVSYLIAAIAGGMISAAVVRHGKIDEVGRFNKVLRDAMILIIMASFLIIGSAVVEMGLIAYGS